MKKLLKAALLTIIGLISVTTVQAASPGYVSGQLIIGFTAGSGTDVLYDLGAASALTNGETWNLSTLLTNRTLAIQNWGVIGNGPYTGTSTSTNWVTSVVGSTPQPINSGYTGFNKIINATAAICTGNGQGPYAFATYPIYAGESGSDAYSDANSWYKQATANATATTSYYVVTANDPTVLGVTDAYFWSELNDGATMTLLGVFTLGTNSVLTYHTLLAGFTGTPTTGSAPLQVVFSDASVGSGVGTNWLWNFGDGHSITNTTSANVTNTYVAAGTNTVTLVVTAAGVASTNIMANYIVVTNGAVTAPVAAFSVASTNVFATQSVVFTNTSTGSFTNSAWKFGNGINVSITNSVGVNVTNTYATAGLYTNTLQVFGAGGASATVTNRIVVSPLPNLGNVTLATGKYIFSGTNCPAGVKYRILTSTNLTLAITNWTPVFTNTFLGNGSYAYTNNSPTNAAAYFLMVSP